MDISVVKYKGAHYVHYKTDDRGRACLINSEGKKYTGRPGLDKLTVVRMLEVKGFHFKTKIGVFNAETGEPTTDPDVLALFVPEEPCKRCNGTGILTQFVHIRGGVCFWCEGTKIQNPSFRTKKN